MRNNSIRYHGNYQTKILNLIAKGKIDRIPGTVNLIQVKHDDWCSIFKGGICNCRPKIVTATQYEGEKKGKSL